MGLIKKIRESLELRREERLIVREMAQERLSNKRLLAEKQKEFDKMLDMRLPCQQIIKLINPFNGDEQYFLIDKMPMVYLHMLKSNKKHILFKIKQLTGVNSGHIYNGNCNPHTGEDKIYMYLNPINKDKLVISVQNYSNHDIDQNWWGNELTDLTKKYGETMTLRQLLLRWKTDNRKFMNINIDEDYEMVKRLYNSEDILAKSKSEELSK